MSDDFVSAGFDNQPQSDLRYDEMDGEDLAPEEVAEAFFSYDEDQFAFRWFANLVGLGVLVAYTLRLTGLVFGVSRDVSGLNIDPDPSPFRLLAAAGEAFHSVQAGLIVLIGAALVVRFRPANDGVRATLRLVAIVVLVGSAASLLGSFVSDTQVSVFEIGDWKVAALHGAGVAVLQAAAALATLKSEREANRVPFVAIVGLLVSATMGFGSIFIDNGFRDESLNGLDLIFSGVEGVRYLPLMAAAILVSLTGWAKSARTVVLVVSLSVCALALAFFVTSVQENAGDRAFFGSTALYVTPSLIFATLIAVGLASMPFVRNAPDS